MDPVQTNGSSEKGGMGMTVATIIVLLVIIVGAFYFWKSDKSTDSTMVEDTSAVTEGDNMEAGADASIEAELDALNVDGVDSSLDESQINAS